MGKPIGCLLLLRHCLLLLRLCGLLENVVALGHEVKPYYIADAVKGEAPTESLTTADARVRITDTLDSVDALDILLIPGPAPTYRCSSSAVASSPPPSPASSPTSSTRVAPYPARKVEWVAERWTTDDDDKKKIWTSGGVTNGTDMVAAYLKENFDPQLAKLVRALADVGDRGQEYPEWQLNLKLDLKLF
ncbi:hypothetical protein ACEPAI_7652 [Sanghuangporus weigelae]